MLIKKITKRTLLSLAVSQLMLSPLGIAKAMNKMDFKTQPLGHGIYEMALVNSRNALFVASSPSFDQDKTSGVVFQLAADSLQIDKTIPTTRRTFSVALDGRSSDLISTVKVDPAETHHYFLNTLDVSVKQDEKSHQDDYVLKIDLAQL